MNWLAEVPAALSALNGVLFSSPALMLCAYQAVVAAVAVTAISRALRIGALKSEACPTWWFATGA